MSAMSTVAGLYPQKGNQVWNPNFRSLPIPVHTRPVADDNILSSHAKCPKLKQLDEELMNSKEIQGRLNLLIIVEKQIEYHVFFIYFFSDFKMNFTLFSSYK